MMKVPNFKDPEVTKFLIEFLRDLDNRDKTKLSTITANHSLLLLAPNLKPYEVTVTNAGALQVLPVDTNALARLRVP